ncbi:hypothetical protein GCM10011340_33840 [Roseivirga thermotolerans]|uniref:Uncharacterized protein n=1 Tax=Roseivirga thermotolerans TaxID=1758176 RepID=A0ABQ3ICQ8_9BACT|nr:hypothetical protein GCM10011340_33840 [Roseivirga thermotolerans]
MFMVWLVWFVCQVELHKCADQYLSGSILGERVFAGMFMKVLILSQKSMSVFQGRAKADR